ncbi:MAG: pilus assembly protein N-terminal domain-containing protein, partial [Candidatus Korobacteraceae bacterium]
MMRRIIAIGIALLLLPVSAAFAQQPGVPQEQPLDVVEPGAAPLRVMVNKSLLINTQDRLRRVSVTDPTIADALVVTPNQVLIHGKQPGEISLLLWDEQERSQTFDLRVDVDVTTAAEDVRRLFPGQEINVSATRNALVLSGHVATEEDAKRAGMVAQAYAKNVINVLTFGPSGAQEVLLEVKFAEVDRTALTQLGMNIFSTGAANTFGTATTQQFGQFTGSRVGGLPDSSGIPDTQVPGNHAVGGDIG